MKIRKYVARSMPEALQQVRDDLGEHAVILNTRQLRRNSRFNPQDEARVEITAAYDGSAPAVAATAADLPDPEPGPPIRPAPWAVRRYGAPGPAAVTGSAATAVSPRVRPISAPPTTAVPATAISAEPSVPVERRSVASAPVSAVSGLELQQLARNLRQVQEALARLERRTAGAVILPEALARLADRLRGLGLAVDLVDSLAQQLLVELSGEALADREAVVERAAALLAGQLPGCRDIRLGSRRRVVGFVGAAGAGKTTAAVKIAAGFSRKRGGRVLLVTADDRGVGALDQARAYGQIIGVPLETAYDEEEMTAVLARHPQARLVLVDLAGCGPRDQRERDRQRRLLAAAGADEVQVVIDGTGSLEHMLDQLEAAELFPERRLLFTKMDEALRPGPAISAAVRSQVATSYLVVGSAVPGEIEAGNLAGLVARAIGVQPADRKGR